MGSLSICCTKRPKRGREDRFDRQLSTSTIGALFGNGDGTFQPPVDDSGGTDRFVGGLVAKDFNGDGIPAASLAHPY
jgi:hypothetical protein